MSTNYDCVKHTIQGNHLRQYARSTSLSQEEVLNLAVKQYKPRYRPCDGDVTIIACHASAFPKELYQPIWESLFESAAKKPEGSRIRAIWIADVSNQGQSGVLNAQKLGNEPSYFDHARDYLCLVNHFREHMIQPLVGFGHSMGGNVIINLALLHPRLLTTVVAIEPIINEDALEMNFVGVFPLTLKKDRWSSRDAAMASITKSPFYARWDARTLDLFRQYGLRDASDDTVTLTTSKHQEVLSFARASFPESRQMPLTSFEPNRMQHPDMGSERNPKNAFYRPESTMTFQQLPFLRPSCLYIYGDKSHMASAHHKGRCAKLRQTGIATGGSGGAAVERVRDTVVDASHFAPFEQPDMIANLSDQWIDTELGIWRTATAAENEAWQGVPLDRRNTVSDDWMFWVQKLWGKKGGTTSKL